MSIEENKEIVLRFFLESHNSPYNGNVIEELATPEFAKQQKVWHELEKTAFPDKHFTIDEVIAEGDKVMLRWTLHATHLGEFWTPIGMAAPTGKRVTATAAVVYRLEDGMITGGVIHTDWLEAVQQFGATVTLPSCPP